MKTHRDEQSLSLIQQAALELTASNSEPRLEARGHPLCPSESVIGFRPPLERAKPPKYFL